MLKQKKNFVKLLAILVVFVSCETYPPPIVERCTAYGALSENSGELFCIKERKEFERFTEQGDICTNGNDYQIMFNYCMDIRKALIECERGRSR